MKAFFLIALLLQTPGAATSKIAGHVVTLPNGSMPTSLTLRVYGNSGGGMDLRPVTVRPDGSFEISGIAPGEFSLSLGDPFNSPSRNFTFREGNVTDFEMKVPVEIPIRTVMADGSPYLSGPVALTTTSPVGATNINRGAPKTMKGFTRLGAGGSLSLMTFPGENSVMVEGWPAGLVLKSVTYGTVDLARSPLQLNSTPTSPIVVTFDRN